MSKQLKRSRMVCLPPTSAATSMDIPWSEWSSTLASHSWCLTMKVKGSAVNLVPCDCGMLGAPVGGDLCELRGRPQGPARILHGVLARAVSPYGPRADQGRSPSHVGNRPTADLRLPRGLLRSPGAALR